MTRKKRANDPLKKVTRKKSAKKAQTTHKNAQNFAQKRRKIVLSCIPTLIALQACFEASQGLLRRVSAETSVLQPNKW